MTNMATLHDGREVPTDSPEWMAECEALAVLGRRSKPQRHAYLERVEAKRGTESRRQLEDRIWAIWQSRRKAG